MMFFFSNHEPTDIAGGKTAATATFLYVLGSVIVDASPEDHSLREVIYQVSNIFASAYYTPNGDIPTVWWWVSCLG